MAKRWPCNSWLFIWCLSNFKLLPFAGSYLSLTRQTMNFTFNEYGQLDEHPDYYADPEPDFMELADYDEAEAERLAKEWFKGKKYAA